MKMNIWVLLFTWFCRTLLVPSPVAAQAPSFCKIPFTYQGVTYRSCTNKNDPAGRDWCSTRTHRNGQHVLGGRHWKHCDEECGVNINSDRIVGGTNANLGVWPWMVLFRSREISSSCRESNPSCSGWAANGECRANPSFMLANCRKSCNICASSTGRETWSCGGSLISAQYVLTAAHCFPDTLQIQFARIGEFDLNRNSDSQNGLTAPAPQDIQVEHVIRHSQYNSPSCRRCNDIALVKLVKRARLHDFVRPICLPSNPLQDMGFSVSQFQGKDAFVVGWGATDVRGTQLASRLQQLRARIQDLPFCTNRKQNSQNSRTIMCAGDGDGRDTCRGDSGGPLMLSDNFEQKWFAVGVTSFGNTICGASGSQGIYTSVYHYINWIQDNMK